MPSLHFKLSRFPALATLAVFSAGAQAPIATTTIAYAPAAAAASPAGVPTLSEWGLIVLVGFMAFAAFRAMRKGGAARLFSLLAFGAAAVIGAAHFATPTQAAPFLAFDQASGGVINWSGVGETAVENTTGVALKITAISYVGGVTPMTPIGTPECVVGLSVNPGAACYIRVINPI